ncbi:malonyl CoA-acyl carrier protein transacylase [Thermodesulfatator indicus DSM 15286]|uniref:Malonyl CoA-acyl carrier protein transacylase n=1 Tax=Thermodesulfatator indicus (strain DSM 15286 / JCM 11887 / CIR29812) TaxID=667014 RepID=F8A8W7_THEID|nr:ACP S-malonyltransferase [Thermodesulfatator indicus]AEH44014.1 malonyl CoA-acyl carrier protein transacylase [Thermodesulfatator indicus DSM 15286]
MRVFMFPGQGSQYVGMGKAAYDNFSEAKRVFEVAEKVTGLPIKKLCFEGPMEELTRTFNLQPALTAVNLAIYEALKAQNFEPEIVCGHSLGEYSALYSAGIVSLEDVFRLVLKRGELMEREAQRRPGEMYAVIGLSRQKLEEILLKAREKGIVALANHNTPVQIVITGEKEATSYAAGLAKEAGARVVKLKVSGAYHSPLMAQAAEDFKTFLKEIPFHSPQKIFFSNVSARAEEDPNEIKKLMGEQIESPVRWVEEIENIFAAGGRDFIEVGPKTVLTGLVKKILPVEKISLRNVENPAEENF